MTHFKIICTGWNAGPWVDGCLGSISRQTYTNYDVCVVDDGSDDGKIADQIFNWCAVNGWNCMLRKERHGALRNQVEGIRMMDPDPGDVIVFLDLDDQFADVDVLSRLDRHYQDGSLVVYTQYQSVPHSPTCAPSKPYPRQVVRTGGYRHYARFNGFCHNHLRSFKAKLFLALAEEDFRDRNGGWFRSAADTVLMVPCMELAYERVKFVNDVMLNYNSANPLSDWRTQPRQCDDDNDWVLSRPRKERLA